MHVDVLNREGVEAEEEAGEEGERQQLQPETRHLDSNNSINLSSRTVKALGLRQAAMTVAAVVLSSRVARAPRR